MQGQCITRGLPSFRNGRQGKEAYLWCGTVLYVMPYQVVNIWTPHHDWLHQSGGWPRESRRLSIGTNTRAMPKAVTLRGKPTHPPTACRSAPHPMLKSDRMPASSIIGRQAIFFWVGVTIHPANFTSNKPNIYYPRVLTPYPRTLFSTISSSPTSHHALLAAGV